MDNRTFGYARVSTDDQEMTLQIAALERYGVDHIFSEHASGKTVVKRKELARVLKQMRGGDVLVVWKLDRLGRNMLEILELVEELKEKKILLVSLTENVDTTSPMGRAFFQIAMVFAELERNMIAERTKAGMAAARAAGKVFGRKPLIWKGERGSAKRIAYLQKLDDAGLLRRQEEGEWVLIPSAKSLMEELNKPRNRDKDDRDIENEETVRRWTRRTANGANWAGLKAPEDDAE